MWGEGKMQLKSMDEELIAIYNIRNLESIKLWDVIQDKSNKALVVPVLSITYDGGKQLSYTAKDEYFNEYVKKVVEVYHDEKNQVYENSLTDPFHLYQGIDIDEHTKQVLDSGLLGEKDKIYHFFEGKKGYDGSLLFLEDEFSPLMDIVFYHVEKLYQVTDQVVQFSSIFRGYQEQYLLSAKVDGIEHFVPLLATKLSDSFYHFELGNTNALSPVTLDLEFKYDAIEVKTSFPFLNMTSIAHYFVTKDMIKSTYEVKKDEVIIRYENHDLEKVDKPILPDFVYQTPNFSWFLLPWKASFGLATSIDEVTQDEKMITIHNLYLASSKEHFLEREHYARIYRRNRTTGMNSLEVVLDEVDKSVIGVSLSEKDHLYLLETHFLDSDLKRNGYYEGKLKNRYFYHLGESKEGFEGLKQASLVSVDSKEVIDASDFLNKAKMKKLVKGDK